MRALFLFLMLLHGAIHLLGFLKAFQLMEVSQLSQHISKPIGLLWLAAAVLFAAAAGLQMLGNPFWPWLGMIAVVLSQLLIIVFWHDAKFGTLVNLIIGLVVTVSVGLKGFENKYTGDVIAALSETPLRAKIITETDLNGLPLPVQKYLRYSGVVGKPQITNMRLVFKGTMREKGKPWFHFTSEQFNFFDEPRRLFFMKAKIKGLPAYGYHSYIGKNADMLIKLAGWFPVVDIKGTTLFPTESVTFLNDICLFAPAALMNKHFRWEPLDDSSARVIFTNRGTSVSATLQFNETGQLINFISDDRMDISAMKAYPFSTPAKDYKAFQGVYLPSYGEAIWHYSEGDFVYGRFNVVLVEYNVFKFP